MVENFSSKQLFNLLEITDKFHPNTLHQLKKGQLGQYRPRYFMLEEKMIMPRNAFDEG